MRRRRGSVGRQTARTNPMIERLEARLLLASQAYTWQNAILGAGGFVDGIYYDPNNQNVIYAHTDIGGLYKSTNDGQSWSQLLDFVGNSTSTSGNGTQEQEIGVLSFAIDPENSNNLYADVGEYTGTDGAVFYSTNAGATWSQTNLSFYVGGNENGRGDEDQIQVDPNDSNIIFLGTNANGLWESTNAGHSFSQVTSFTPTSTSTTFVLFDPSGTAGSPSQTIFVGANATSAGTNLYETTNGGTSWSEVAIASGSGPTDQLPGRGVISGGYLYLTYSNVLAPSSTPTGGGVYQYNLSTGAWANITPGSTTAIGFIGVAADPENPNTIVVSTFNDYGGPDQIYRTVDANVASPTWTAIFDDSSSVQDNFGFGPYNTTRNYTEFPYIENSGDGPSNWIDALAIDPFNSNQLMYGTGQGIWATNNLSDGGTNDQLTAANSWYFPDLGIEFTAVGSIVAGSSGVPLFSAMGDIYGFADTTLTASPAQGSDGPFASAYAVDEADNLAVIAGQITITTGESGTSAGTGKTYYGMYSTNDGLTYTPFTSSPATTTGTGTIAVSANGATIVWVQGALEPYYSTNDGTSWTKTSTTMATGGKIYADRVNASDFYYYVGTDVYFSSNGGQTFTLETSTAPSGARMAVNPFVTGDLWIAAAGGIYHSSNDGATFAHPSSISTNSLIALGAPAPGQTIPAIYVWGNISGFLGIYRSDDGGSTWTLINSVSQQWGGGLEAMTADPNVFGRVYISTNGRGVLIGNPASSLPAGWTDTDINSPGNPGWATSSTTLSNGNTVNEWIIDGGGNGLSGNTFSVTSLTDSDTTGPGPVFATAVTSTTDGLAVGDQVTIAGATNSGYDGTFLVASIVNSTTFTYVTTPGLAKASGTITATTNDQFNFAYEPVSGNVTASAQLLSLTNADDGKGTPVAGVMIRSSTDDNDPFVAMVQTAGNSLEFEYRTTSGGAVSTVTLASVPVGAEYVEIVRDGSSFSGYYSSNDSTWTQLGPTVSISAMPTTANVGLAATADFNSQLTSATFNHVNITPGFAPVLTAAAAANPSPVTATTTNLTALATENGSGSGLTYTWSATTVPNGVAAPTYSANGTNGASSTVATFYGVGSYAFLVTITDASSNSITSSVNVTVNQTLTSITVTPGSARIDETATQPFSATADDQFDNAMSTQPTFAWSLGNGSIGSVNSSTGLYTAPSSSGSATVIASSGSVNGSANVTVLPATVADEYMFYFGSSAFDGGDTSPSSADLNAIAENADGSDKNALAAGGTGSFANVSSYSDGLNGILIAFSNLPSGTSFTSADFQFNVGNNTNTSTWSSAPTPTAIATWTSGGQTYADIVWANNAIEEEWLQVTVNADANTLLANNDVFYFGSEIGATGVSTASTSNGEVLRVTSADVVNTENNASLLQSVPISNIYDFNRDGKVTSTDVVLCQNNATLLGGLLLFTPSDSGDDVIAAASSTSSTTSTIAAAAAPTNLFSTTPIDDSASATSSVLQQDDDPLASMLKHRRH
jgi:hypothetical protein